VSALEAAMQEVRQKQAMDSQTALRIVEEQGLIPWETLKKRIDEFGRWVVRKRGVLPTERELSCDPCGLKARFFTEAEQASLIVWAALSGGELPTPQ